MNNMYSYNAMICVKKFITVSSTAHSNKSFFLYSSLHITSSDFKNKMYDLQNTK